MEKIIKGVPIFIPRINGTELKLVKLGAKSALMDAYIVAQYPIPARKIASICDLFIIDPSTNYFVERYFLRKVSFRKLPYSPKAPFNIEDLLVDESLRVKKLIEPAINYQINQKAKVIIAPYLFTGSPTDIKFGINLTMISDSIKYVERKKIKEPVFAMINMGSAILDDPKTLNYIIERYDDDFGERIHGYFIMLDQFKEKEVSESSLLGLAYLVFQLSKNKNVFALRIGAFGEVLSAIGASGFSSGLSAGESFSEETLKKESGGFGRPTSKWTYIPDFFSYISDEEIKKTSYKCGCSKCRGSLPKTVFDKKAHLLTTRMAITKKLSSLSRNKRIDFMKYRLGQGIKLITEYNKKYGLAIKPHHLLRWISVLDSAKSWKHNDTAKQEDIDLDNLIHQARAKRKK